MFKLGETVRYSTEFGAKFGKIVYVCDKQVMIETKSGDIITVGNGLVIKKN